MIVLAMHARIDSRARLAAALLALAAAGALAAPVRDYTVDVAPDLGTLQIRACDAGTAPPVLHNTMTRASRYLMPGLPGDAEAGDLGGDGLLHAPVRGGACIRYRVDLTRAAREDRGRGMMPDPATGNVMLPVANWLWLPPNDARSGPIEFRFQHAAGQSVSMPWRLLERNATRTRFEYLPTPESWRAVSAFGNFPVREVPVPGTILRLGILNSSNPAPDPDAVVEWIRHGAMAVTLAYGRFPLPTAQVLVVPIGPGNRGPVPWGQVLRGGGAAAHLFIDETRPFSEHTRDWTLTHELSHMLHPYLGDDGRWLAEGLATYYQNVLQARIGTLTPQRAWEKLHEGFRRGISQTYPGVSLHESVSRGGRGGRRQTMRVYWTGAAMALLADLALRHRGLSLDEAMSRFQNCCLPSDRDWSTAEYMARLDDLTGAGVFTMLLARYLDSDQFPDLSDAYAALGLVGNGELLEFSGDPLAAALRAAIMTAPAPRGDTRD